MVGGMLAPHGFGIPFFVISLLAIAFTPIAWLSLPRDGAVCLFRLWQTGTSSSAILASSPCD